MPRSDNQWTPEEIARHERQMDDMEEKRRERILRFSPDPYGVFGVAIDNIPLYVPKASDFVPKDLPMVTSRNHTPEYVIHPRVHGAIVGLLAMHHSCAVKRIRPELYEGFTYVTPENVSVNVEALIDSALVFTRIIIPVSDGAGNDFSKVFELNETGKIMATRLHILAKLFDGGKPYGNKSPDTE